MQSADCLHHGHVNNNNNLLYLKRICNLHVCVIHYCCRLQPGALSMMRVWVWLWFTWLQKYHYNKAPFIWLAMVTYWRKNNHELYQLIWKNLVIFDEYLLENAHTSDQRQMIMTVQKKSRRSQRLHFRADKLKATFETTLQQIIIPCFHESTLTT